MTTKFSKSTIPGHPQYSETAREYSSPRPNSRVKPEAQEYADRNHGSIGKWFNQQENKHFESPRPAPKACPSPLAQEMKDRSRGSMGDFIGSGSEYKPPAQKRTIHPRAVKGEAAEIAQSHKGGSVNLLMGSYGNLPPEPAPAARLTSEGESNAELCGHKGTAVANLFNRYGQMGGASGRVPRVRPEATAIAGQHLGQGVAGRMKPDGTSRPVGSAGSKLTSGGGGGGSGGVVASDTFGSSRPQSRNESYQKRNATQWI